MAYNNTPQMVDGNLSLSSQLAALSNRILALENNALMFRGAASDLSTNFNDIVYKGLYTLTGTAMTNAPSGIYQWCHMLVLNGAYNSGTTWTTQIVFSSGNTAAVAVRRLVGNPSSWTAWTYS